MYWRRDLRDMLQRRPTHKASQIGELLPHCWVPVDRGELDRTIFKVDQDDPLAQAQAQREQALYDSPEWASEQRRRRKSAAIWLASAHPVLHRPFMRLKNVAGRFTTFAPDALRFVGRVAGLGAGVFVGMMDIGKWWDERSKGDTSGLAGWYFASGALAISLTAYGFVAAAFGPVGWILLGAILLVTLHIETQKDNKLHEWLSRCHFGMGDDKYQDQTQQLKEYQQAVQ